LSYEFVDRMMEQSRAGELRSPVAETLDMHLVEFGRGEAVYEMEARAELGNPLGVIQGGVATALADATMAAATTTILTDEEIQKTAITTIDIFSRFMRPVSAGKVERLRAFSVQYHPEAAPGPHDAAYLFDDFTALMEASR